jgi:DNA-binding NarL/FixJ family response regulator
MVDERTVDQGLVLLFDKLGTRREYTRLAMKSWADMRGLQLSSHHPDDVLMLRQQEGIRLTIVNVGSGSLRGKEECELLVRVRDRFAAPCAVFSDAAYTDEVVAAAEIGLRAYLPGAMPLDIVKDALAFVMIGGTFFPPEAFLSRNTSLAAERTRRFKSAALSELTARQIQVLEHLRCGQSNKLIARNLRIEEATVKVHVRHIMRKLGASNRTEAALLGHSISSPLNPTCLDRPPGEKSDGRTRGLLPACAAILS